MTAPHALQHMTHWLERAVIGLNLCPFAKAVHVKGQIHWVLSDAQDDPELLSILERELQSLQGFAADVRDTTLVVLTQAYPDFYDFNDFVGRANRWLKKRRFEGEFQLAFFHPRFVFAGTDEDDITNATNRAPYPTLHLLREASVDRAVQAFPQAEAIFDHNMHTMTQLGDTGWREVMAWPRPATP